MRYTNPSHYPDIDTFRVLAILWIVLHHIRAFFDTSVFASWGILFSFMDRITKLGHLGVEIFFVISGFLISGILIKQWDQKVHIKHFYIRRARRILPLYAVTVMAGLGFMAAAHPLTFRISLTDIVVYALLIQNYTVQPPLLSHTWFVAVIVHFYILYALIVWSAFRICRTPSSRRKTLLWILASLIIAMNIKRAIFLSSPEVPVHMYQTTGHRLDALLFGCLLRLGEPWIMPQAKRLWMSWIILATGVALYLYCLTFLFFDFHKHWYSVTLSYLAAGALLIAFLSRPGTLQRLRLLSRLGPYTYGIFLIHPLIASALNTICPEMPIMLRLFLYVAGSLLAGVFISKAVKAQSKPGG